MRAPAPVRRRWANAMSTAHAAWAPAMPVASGMPICAGGRSASPERNSSPPAAWAMSSVSSQSAWGPSRPKGLTVTWIRVGDAARGSNSSGFSGSPSITTSATRHSSASASVEWGSSNARLRLPAFAASQAKSARRSRLSPRSASTTSAPNRLSICPQMGAVSPDRSSTRMPASGSGRLSGSGVEFIPASSCAITPDGFVVLPWPLAR